MSRLSMQLVVAAVWMSAALAGAQAPAVPSPPIAASAPAPAADSVATSPPSATPATNPTAARSASSASQRAVPDGAASADKSCIAAGRKLDRERRALASAQDELARYAELQQGCASKSVCARYVAAITSLDKRVARHQLRIGKFVESRDHACKT